VTIIPPPAYDTDPNPPFLGMYLDEDLGLKDLLSGVTVTDLNSTTQTPRPVPVWFHNPEREERRITYPNITINFTGERVAHEREHRGWVQIHYRYLQNIPFDDAFPVFMENPVPIDLDYTVTASARINQHISQISGSLVQGRLHARFAQVTCPGGTVRRVEVLGVTRANGMESDKRLFRQIYRIRIPTEIEAAVAISQMRVRHVVLGIVDLESNQLLAGKRTVVTTADQTSGDNPSGQYLSQTAGD
jgi:hypothetical protein